MSVRVKIQHKLYISSFFIKNGCLIVGKESDRRWEEEVITKKEEKEE